MRRRPVWLGMALIALATPLAGQTLGQRIESVREGWVTFRTEVKDGVEVCERGIRVRSEGEAIRTYGRRGSDASCSAGPLQVEVRVAEGRVREVEARPLRERAGATALGAVEPGSASRFLVELAYRDASEEAVEAGFFLAQLPRGIAPSGGILRAAGDRALPAGVRRSALFWAGQLAADRVVAELALEAPHPKTRRTAFFWLAQRDEPRVADFLAEVILGHRNGGAPPGKGPA
ncbi:MAG: hypothetical protein RQ751_12250 [Longimicrobiales bacterium]|nr:hypothetical protein [Longimicrobiales bacterium]